MQSVEQNVKSGILLKTVLVKFNCVVKIHQNTIPKQNLGKRGVHFFLNKRDGKKYIYLEFLTKIRNEVVKLKVALDKDYHDKPEQFFKRSFPFDKNSFYELNLRVYNRSEKKGKGCIFFLETYQKVSIKQVKQKMKRILFEEKDYNPNINISNIRLLKFDYLFRCINEYNYVFEKYKRDENNYYRLLYLFDRKNPDYHLFIDIGLESLLAYYDKNDIKQLKNDKFVLIQNQEECR